MTEFLQKATKETKEDGAFVPFVSLCEVSCRWPVLVLVGLGLCWLVAGLGLALIASVKLVAPGLLADYAWLTYGRIQPAAWNALVYGFAVQVGLGVGLWLVCRLSGAPLIGRAAVVLAALVWNIGLKIGIFGILIGDSTGVETLELPAYASPILFCAYVCVAVCAALTFHARRERELYVSHWYVLGALLAFPWLYSAANLLAVIAPLRGVLQAAVQAWYAHNLFTVWLAFIGLAALFYFIPKLAGAPIPSRRLAAVGFWTLALFGSLAGLQRYAGGPFPAWLLGVSVVAGVCTLVPVLAVIVNLAGALRGRGARLDALGHELGDASSSVPDGTCHSPPPIPTDKSVGYSLPPWRAGNATTSLCPRALSDGVALRFAVFAFCAYALGGVLAVANALPPVRRLTHFTLFSTALEQLVLQGFVAMALYGALYSIVPRLLACEWPSPRAIRAHFGCVMAGACVSFLTLALGGVLQGRALENPAIAFDVVVQRCRPYLLAAVFANALLSLGALALMVHFLWLLGRRWRARCVPVVREWFREQPPAGHVAQENEASTAPRLPLTPALSPRERENRIQRCREPMRVSPTDGQKSVPPLPWGEGRGEGEHCGRTRNGSRHSLISTLGSLTSMNRGWLVGIGLLLALAASAFILVIWPQLQLGGLEMVTIEATGQSYPLPRQGDALQGQEVYRANGCQYCHTQQVRSLAAGADLARGWGSRRTVARDYLRDAPVMLGTLRLGPDLANVGARQTNALNLLLRLYNPRLLAPGSLMPPHPFLFEQRRLRPGRGISAEALRSPAASAPPAGYEVVPRAEALALAAYLQSLRAEAFFFEVYPAFSTNPAPFSAPSPRPSPPMGERGDGIR